MHITELGGEYFRFDEVRQELRGERTGIRYAIGARVRVQVSRVDLDGRKIDFRIVREAEAEQRLLSRGRKGEGAQRGAAPTATAAEQLAAVDAQDRQIKRASRKTKAGGSSGAARPPASKTPSRGGKPASKRSKR